MTATAPAPRLQRLDGLRILVVEDDPDARTRASLVLAQAGASVQTVTSAREALHVLAEDRPDALVSDIDLSGEDGYALIQRIRQHEATHGGFLPAVALSGYARAAARARTRGRIPGAGREARRTCGIHRRHRCRDSSLSARRWVDRIAAVPASRPADVA